MYVIFQSTLSVRRATDVVTPPRGFEGISIHALREESDTPTASNGGMYTLFQSTLSVRRATLHIPIHTNAGGGFQSTLSVRRATYDNQYAYGNTSISIHALREESDNPDNPYHWFYQISIHALREESDWNACNF